MPFIDGIDPVSPPDGTDAIVTAIGELYAPITNTVAPYWEEQLFNGHITEAVYHMIMDDYVVLRDSLITLQTQVQTTTQDV